MPRLKEVHRADADASVIPFYDALFGKDRDPVSDPGNSNRNPRRLVDSFRPGTRLSASYGGGLSILSGPQT